MIAAADETWDAETRLRHLLRITFTAVVQEATPSREAPGAVELVLQSSATHPLVAPTLARVTKRRLAYLTGLFAELGLSQAGARDRALLAYTAFLGHAQLAHATPAVLPRGRTLRSHVDQVVDALVEVDG